MLTRKKKSKSDKKIEVKKKAIADLEKLKQELSSSDKIEQLSKRYFRLINTTFSRLFNIHYEFTYEELIQDIGNKRIAPELKDLVKEYAEKLIKIEYAKKKLSKNNLKDLIRDFEKIINIDKVEETSEKKPGLLSRLLPKKKTAGAAQRESVQNIEEKKTIPKKEPEELPKLKELPKTELPGKPKKSLLNKFISKIKTKKTETMPPPPKFLQDKDSKLGELPEFDITETKKVKQSNKKTEIAKQKLDKNIDKVLEKITSDKESLSDQYEKITQEKSELEQQKKKIKNYGKKISSDKLKKIQESFDVKKSDLDQKENLLKKREEQLNKKLEEVNKLKKEVGKLSTKVSTDEALLKNKEQELMKKEALLNEIKKEIDIQNKKAISEITKFKKNLKQKQKKFLELQKYYNLRENRLSVNESHFLEAKQKHFSYLEKNIQKHKELLEKDLLKIETELTELTEKQTAVDNKINDTTKKHKSLLKEKEVIENELKTKEVYFHNLENEFKNKEPKLKETAEDIDTRENNLLHREKELNKLELDLENLKEKIRNKLEELELKSLDIKNIENKVENTKLRHEARKKAILDKQTLHLEQLKKYQDLKKEIDSSLGKRKHKLNKITEKLKNKETTLKSKKRKTDKFYEGLDYLGEDVFGMDYNLEEDEEIHIKEISVTKEEQDISQGVGSPELLEMYRLLNIAKIAISRGKFEDAEKLYLQINETYERLNADEQEEVFNDILRVYRPKEERVIHVPSGEASSGDITYLLNKFNETIENKNIAESSRIYNEIQGVYRNLPDREKDKYYYEIMKLYNQVSEIHDH
ncbi:hypothetical protein JXB41_02420 [Candidatus Woesearchaeota archaeon]|nr:hypothetical protein [Candidatus Woesearchaeota archaeon]